MRRVTMLIDVSDIKTISIEVEKKIWEKFTAMPRSITSKIKAYEIKYNRDVNCAIENYIGPSSAYHFYEELISVFEQYDIVCYHSTKMLDENLILAAGLTGGGTGVGISALMDNTTDIAMASRPIKFSEKMKLKAAKQEVEEVIIAYDALADRKSVV